MSNALSKLIHKLKRKNINTFQRKPYAITIKFMFVAARHQQLVHWQIPVSIFKLKEGELTYVKVYNLINIVDLTKIPVYPYFILLIL